MNCACAHRPCAQRVITAVYEGLCLEEPRPWWHAKCSETDGTKANKLESLCRQCLPVRKELCDESTPFCLIIDGKVNSCRAACPAGKYAESL